MWEFWKHIEAAQPNNNPATTGYAGGMTEAEVAELYELAYGKPQTVTEAQRRGYKLG